MEGDDVALGIDLVTGFHTVDMAIQVPCGIDGDEGVAAVDLHTQPSCGIGQRTADGTEADNTQFLITDLVTCKLGLALLHQLCNIRAFLDGLNPVDAANDVAAGQQHAAQCQLHDGIGIGAGGVEYHDALIRTGGQRNIVDTGTGTGDRQQVFRHFHIMHGGRTHQNAVRFLQRSTKGIVFLPEGSTLLGDFIEIMYLVHGVSLP